MPKNALAYCLTTTSSAGFCADSGHRTRRAGGRPRPARRSARDLADEQAAVGPAGAVPHPGVHAPACRRRGRRPAPGAAPSTAAAGAQVRAWLPGVEVGPHQVDEEQRRAARPSRAAAEHLLMGPDHTQTGGGCGAGRPVSSSQRAEDLRQRRAHVEHRQLAVGPYAAARAARLGGLVVDRAVGGRTPRRSGVLRSAVTSPRRTSRPTRPGRGPAGRPSRRRPR